MSSVFRRRKYPFYRRTKWFINSIHLSSSRASCASFMADMHGRVTGKAGVCSATLGPGLSTCYWELQMPIQTASHWLLSAHKSALTAVQGNSPVCWFSQHVQACNEVGSRNKDSQRCARNGAKSVQGCADWTSWVLLPWCASRSWRNVSVSNCSAIASIGSVW